MAMKSKKLGPRSWKQVRRDLWAFWCAVLLVPGQAPLVGCGVFFGGPAQDSPATAVAKEPDKTQAPQPAATPEGAVEETATKLPPEQLESLVAPIALYPDALLAQTLVASTYPLEIIQLQQWLTKNSNLKDQALADAAAKQPWDPSIQSMAAVPDVVKRLADDISWTTDLGNAFLAQQSDVMDAVQRMRQKAKDKGALESNEQQTVETKVIEEKTVIVVESANPEVIYVPSYSPTVVYGAPIYPYPPIYYPPYPPGAAFVSFGFGVMMGAAFWGGSCCGCGWGGNNVNINVNNNFNRNTGNRGGGNWQHRPEHRGGAPYSDRATANKYGGSARGQSPSNRQAGGRQQAGASNRAGVSDRSSAGRGNPSASNRAGSSGRAGGDQIGNRSIQKGSGSRSGGGLGGSSYSGSSARASSSRGSASMGSRGGGSRGGGGGRRR